MHFARPSPPVWFPGQLNVDNTVTVASATIGVLTANPSRKDEKSAQSRTRSGYSSNVLRDQAQGGNALEVRLIDINARESALWETAGKYAKTTTTGRATNSLYHAEQTRTT